MSSCPATLAAVLLLLGSAAAAAPASAPAASVHPELWPAATPALDAGTEAFVEDLLVHMSLEDKVGQMIQADIASISPAELRTYKLG
ncbi:MAG TPA: hypothetical protein VNW26_02875, partial [Steroidobacteraceae bacterium]|nr:hypothetical protein [Steroidobacteraceae bacterium]